MVSSATDCDVLIIGAGIPARRRLPCSGAVPGAELIGSSRRGSGSAGRGPVPVPGCPIRFGLLHPRIPVSSVAGGELDRRWG